MAGLCKMVTGMKEVDNGVSPEDGTILELDDEDV